MNVQQRLLLISLAKYFGVQVDIVSDRDQRFISRFLTSFIRLLGSKLSFSIANYPKSDG